VDDDLSRFFDSIQDLHPKLSVVLWQFPFSFKYVSDEEMAVFRTFLNQLPNTVKHVVEFRHTSWFREDTYTLLNQHNIGFVINDSSRFPAVEKVTGNIVYLRFHGPALLYASSYSTEALQAWAGKIRDWLGQYEVYAYFNNDYGGRAIADTTSLRQYINLISN
jgi:uncharacterized protein YecE (DUF72 family)